jgi:hypothetical protein
MECSTCNVMHCINFSFMLCFLVFLLFFEVDGKLQFATPLMLGQPLMVTWFGFCKLLTVSYFMSTISVLYKHFVHITDKHCARILKRVEIWLSLKGVLKSYHSCCAF